MGQNPATNKIPVSYLLGLGAAIWNIATFFFSQIIVLWYLKAKILVLPFFFLKFQQVPKSSPGLWSLSSRFVPCQPQLGCHLQAVKEEHCYLFSIVLLLSLKPPNKVDVFLNPWGSTVELHLSSSHRDSLIHRQRWFGFACLLGYKRKHPLRPKQ